ncbi:MAG: hypothetical protein J07HX5_00369, partial [halophilic archaeon J07HX5]
MLIFHSQIISSQNTFSIYNNVLLFCSVVTSGAAEYRQIAVTGEEALCPHWPPIERGARSWLVTETSNIRVLTIGQSSRIAERAPRPPHSTLVRPQIPATSSPARPEPHLGTDRISAALTARAEPEDC